MTEISDDVRTVIVEREMPHRPEKLWRALTEPHLIAEWLMNNDFAPTVGHCFKLKGEWCGVLDCEVLVVEPNRRLSYTWNHTHEDEAYNLRSIVTLTLIPTATGTHLRMEQSGFMPGQKQAFHGAHHGWRNFLEKLDAVAADLD